MKDLRFRCRLDYQGEGWVFNYHISLIHFSLKGRLFEGHLQIFTFAFRNTFFKSPGNSTPYKQTGLKRQTMNYPLVSIMTSRPIFHVIYLIVTASFWSRTLALSLKFRLLCLVGHQSIIKRWFCVDSTMHIFKYIERTMKGSLGLMILLYLIVNTV